MDLTPRVLEMRRRALDWFETMQDPAQGFGVHADSPFHKQSGPPGMYLPGTYNAVNCLCLLGAFESITAAQAGELAAILNRFQLPDGAFRIPEIRREDIYYPDFEYIDLHTTNYALGALAQLGRAPALPLAFIARYDTPEKLARWLDARRMAEPWTEGNYVVNLASFYAYLLKSGQERFRPLLEQLLAWHDAHQDPASGYWYDPSTRDLTSAMAGAAHNLHLYYFLNRPVPRFEKIIDHCLGILEGVSSACLDIDVVDILANLYEYGYRQAEIEAYLERKLAALLDFQNPDGGFADVRQGVRLFDGWEGYQEPQGLSNTFSTWFRCATAGMICHVLYPQSRPEWRFRSTLGMGYFHPRPPSGAPDVPASRPEVTPMPVLSAASGPENTPSPAPLGPEAARLRERVRARLEALPSIRLASAEAVYQIDIDGPGGGSLLIAIQGGRAEVTTGASSQAKVCLTLAAATLERLLDGKLNATVAYMTKKLKIRGDIAAAMKLEGLLK